MKITNVKTYVLLASLGDLAFGWSQRVGNSRQTAICVVETDVGIEGYGIEVVERVPIIVEPGPDNLKYLSTKQAKMGHMID